jgi:hypothetical protein
MDPNAVLAFTWFFKAHSALRYLVLAGALAACAYFALALASGRAAPRRDRAIAAAFTGLIDLQLLLGIGVLLLGRFYPALVGHIVMMVVTAMAVHVASFVYRRRKAASVLPLFVGAAVGLLLMVAGVMALGRGLLTHTAF